MQRYNVVRFEWVGRGGRLASLAKEMYPGGLVCLPMPRGDNYGQARNDGICVSGQLVEVSSLLPICGLSEWNQLQQDVL